MYAIIPQQIPRDKRAEVNEKILFAIDSGKDLIPKESIYNCYTGIGGLHNFKQVDFPAITGMRKPRKNSRWVSSSPLMSYAGAWWRSFPRPLRNGA